VDPEDPGAFPTGSDSADFVKVIVSDDAHLGATQIIGTNLRHALNRSNQAIKGSNDER